MITRSPKKRGTIPVRNTTFSISPPAKAMPSASPTTKYQADKPGPSTAAPATAPVNKTLALDKTAQGPGKPVSFIAAAKVMYTEANAQMAMSGNIKTSIKKKVLECIKGLYELVEKSERTMGRISSSDIDELMPTIEAVTDSNPEILKEIKDVKKILKNMEIKPAPSTNDQPTQIDMPKVIRDSIREEIGKVLDEMPLSHPTSTDMPKIIRDTIREEMSKVPKPTTSSSPVHPQSNTTYASVAAAPPKRKPKPPTASKPAIIISAKEQVKSKDEVYSAWRKSISFRNSSFAPVRTVPISNYKLRVEFEDNEQQNQVLQKLSSSNIVCAEPAKRLRPMVVLKGIHTDVKPEELVNIILSQNETIRAIVSEADDLAFRFKRNNKKPHLYNAVLWATPQVWRGMLNLTEINIDHQKIQAEEFVPLLQCFKCLQYGHTQARCTSETSACSHCSEKEHTFRDCPNKTTAAPKCYNCVEHNRKYKTSKPVDHTATSMYCSIHKIMETKIIERTDYGSK